MVTRRVKVNVTYGVTKWAEALTDAQKQLKKVQQEVASWKGAIQICRRRISENAPWPGDSEAHRHHRI